MFRIISHLIPGWFIRSNCHLLNSIYLWAARGAYNEEEIALAREKRVSRNMAELAEYRWDLVVSYIGLLAEKTKWAQNWKTVAKAYRAMALSQRDALDRHMQWIDPTAELPVEGQLIAWLREKGRITVAHHAYPDRAWQRQAIGWHPLPNLSRVDKSTPQT